MEPNGKTQYTPLMDVAETFSAASVDEPLVERRTGKGLTPPLLADLEFENINVHVKTGDGRRHLLKDVTGHAAHGELLAIMGPSGSGKTTLLNSLAGLHGKMQMTGDILVNGQPRTKLFRRQTGYVRQDDLLHPTLTVTETLSFYAKLRLSPKVPTKKKAEIVDRVICELGLEKVRNTRIGNETTRGVSGGERKRVSIGIELVTNAGLIFLDEPTSGLDSTSAFQLLQLLNALCRQGRTIVCTIHQPRSNIYQLFDKLMLLTDGHVVYGGPASLAVDYFKGVGYACGEFMNPADYFLDVLSRDEVRDRFINAYAQYRQDNPQTLPTPSEDLLTPGGRHLAVDHSEPISRFATSFLYQSYLLTKRALQTTFRSPAATYIEGFENVFLAVLAGMIFFRLELNQEGIQSREGALFFILTHMVFSTQPSLVLFLEEKEIFLRESSSGFYRVSAYFIAKCISEVPLRVIFPLIFCTITYFMCGFNLDWDRFLLYCATCILVNNTAGSFMVLVGTFVPDFQSGGSVSSLVMVLMMLTGGYFANAQAIPVWISWLQYVSFVKYGFSALTINEFVGLKFTCHDFEKTNGTCAVPDGETELKKLHVRAGEYDLYYNLAALGLMWLVFRVLSYVILRVVSARTRS